MLKIYVAARYTRKMEAKTLAEMLAENGFKVTSTWFEEPLSPTIQLNDVSDAKLIEYAKRDVEEIDAADALVLLSDGPKEAHPRGGKHWETGYATGKGKKIVVFGPVENIFHVLPDVIVVPEKHEGELFSTLRNIRYQARWDRRDVLSAYPVSSSGAQPMSGGGMLPGQGLPPSGSASAKVRGFSTGATRNPEGDKLDYEGFLSPTVLEAFGKYMHVHRHQRDGSLRDSDNWQKGIPLSVYMKSLVRHTLDFWRLSRGGNVIDPDTKKPANSVDLACAIMFNVMGWLHETLKLTTTEGKG